MILTVKRRSITPEYTIGNLFVNGSYFCDTLEPPVQPSALRPKGCIPEGTYKVSMGIVSPKYSQRKSYAWCGGRLPRLMDVPGFDGVLIHAGNTVEDTLGCLLVGQNRERGKVLDSMRTLQLLYSEMQRAAQRKEPITITYQQI